jgi:ABC-type transport system substrate-binding protein
MVQRRWFEVLTCLALAGSLAVVCPAATPASKPGGMLTVAVATFAAIAKEGSANSLAPEFRLIKSMEVEDPYTLTLRFEKPFVPFGNKVTQGLFASSAFIQSKKVIETLGQEAERHPVATGPWKFVEHIRGATHAIAGVGPCVWDRH